MNLKIGKVFTSKFVGTGPSSYKKEFTGPWSHKVRETLVCSIIMVVILTCLSSG